MEPTPPSRPGLRERKRVATWHAIRDAAYRLFLDRGYANVTVDEISDAANVSRKTFFNYFCTKEAVLRDPAPGERDRWLPIFDRPAGEPLRRSLAEILVRYAEIVAESIVLNRRLMEKSPELAPMTLDRRHPFYDDLDRFVADRTRAGAEFEAAVDLATMLAAAETAYRFWSLDSPFVDILGRALAHADAEPER